MASVGNENDRYIHISSHLQCENSNTCSTLCMLFFREARNCTVKDDILNMLMSLCSIATYKKDHSPSHSLNILWHPI